MPASELAPARAAEAERLTAAVRDAGVVALKYFRGELKSWTKGETRSPVTEADIAVNELLHKLLPQPGDGWLSEESENDPSRLQAQRVWVVDPIDGTRAYIAGREDWSISVALVEQGRPALAALFAPATDEMFFAAAGNGATRNGVPVRVSAGSNFDGARLGGPKRLLEWLAARHSELIVMPRIHSLALRLARTSTGELEAAIAGGNSHDWDLAAADLLVHEAGGLMTALDGRPVTYNRPDPVHGLLVAAGRERHGALIELVRAHSREAA